LRLRPQISILADQTKKDRTMRRIWLTILVLLFAGCIIGNRAAAIEVTCIESSKYRHLYQLFGGDPKKLATYLQIDANRLPDPEFCRAALITGKIEPAKAQDVNKLLEFIVKNQGWLAALHLSSEGGAIGPGYQLAFLARAFWLKTYTVSTSGTMLLYMPDFFVPPLAAPPGPAATGTAAAGATPELRPNGVGARMAGVSRRAKKARADDGEVSRLRFGLRLGSRRRDRTVRSGARSPLALFRRRRADRSVEVDVGDQRRADAIRRTASLVLSADGRRPRFHPHLSVDAARDDNSRVSAAIHAMLPTISTGALQR
jgi:hypothetical protein